MTNRNEPTPTRTNHPRAAESERAASERAALTRIHRMRAIHATRFIALDATPRASTPRARRRAVVKRAHFRHVTTRASGDDDDGASTDDSSNASASSRAGLDGGKYGMGERIDRALDATTNQLGFVVGGFVLTLSAVALFTLGPRPPTEY